MPLLALGLNHQTAPVERSRTGRVRARAAASALRDLLDCGGAREAAILSTCNRTEVYCGLKDENGRQVVEWLGDYHKLRTVDLQPYLYRHTDQRAVRHILRVASGLDSMVLGEPQILGQIKAAYQVANSAGALGSGWSGCSSIPSRSPNRCAPIPASAPARCRWPSRRSVWPSRFSPTCPAAPRLLIGAGDTIELVARHLHESGVGRLIVANRTLERAHALAASFAGYAIALDEIPAHLGEADIVIAATASPDPLLGATLVRQCLKQRRHRPMFMVDLAVPRDIDPAVAELDDVYLYTVDDLKDIIQDNLRSRQAAAQQAEEIIDTQVEHFMAWLRTQGSVASIRALRRQAEATRDEAMDRARRQLAQGKDPTTVLEMLAHTLTNKFLHVPCTGLREAAAEGDAAMLNLIKTLYRLGDGDPHR
jgi:glutamyl-tRNA reductase